MKTWDVLLQQSILGLQGNAALIDCDDDALNAVLQTLVRSENNERGFLRCAALVNNYQKAGEKRPKIAKIPLLSTAKEESLALCSPASALRLRTLLMQGGQELLVKEWCHLAHAAKQRVSYNLLPLLLQAGRRQRDLRALIIKVMGERGLWVAAFNPDWVYARASAENASEKDWELLPDQERVLYLSELRKTQPNVARESLIKVWKQESAKQRLALLATFKLGLSDEDSDFLEGVLSGDRGKNVRKQAAELLMALTNSPTSQKMQTALLPLIIKSEKKQFLRSKKTQLELQLPEAYDNNWTALGVDAKPSAQYKKIGQKAWWLEQLLVWIPPRVWAQIFDVSAQELIELAKASDWEALLINVWQKSCIIYHDVDLAEALFNYQNVFSGKKNLRYDLAETVFNILPMSRRQQLIQQLLPKLKRWEDYLILSGWSFRWDKPLSLQVVQQLIDKPPKSERYYNYAADEALKVLAIQIDLACFDELNQNNKNKLQNPDEEEGVWERFYQTYHSRYQMQQEFIQ